MRGADRGPIMLRIRRKSPISFAAMCALQTTSLNASDTDQSLPLQPQVDLILTNGEIRTPSGWSKAMAVADGVILAVGDNEDVKQFKNAEAETINLKGKTVLPGLMDMHVHATGAGLEQFRCRIRPGAAADEIAKTVAACVAEKQPGEWIVGGNWVAAGFEEGQQNKEFLDRVAPDNPVALSDESHHTVWANSAALELAGVTKDTPDPEGGVIDRDENGEPTGLFRETAEGLIYRVVPPATEDDQRKALRLSSNQMLSYGITGFTDAGITIGTVANMSAMSANGSLKQRVRGCMRWTPLSGDNPAANGEALIEARAQFSQPRFKLDCVKIVLDGVPTESRTAVMVDPYVGGDYHGLPMIAPEILDPAVARFDRQGLLIKFHAAGDGAVRQAIDSVAAARKTNGWGGPAHDVGHDSFVDPDDIPRVRDLHMAWEFSPYIWYPTPIADKDIRAAIGDERMKRWIPIKDAVQSGALVVAGSDWSVVPSVNPWLAIETMVTRQMPGGSKETLGEGQRVSLDDALRIFTENAAMQMGLRDKVGSIEPGMRADIIVVEKNPFDVPITKVHETKVLMTFIDGEKVYDAASPPQLSAD